SIDLRSSSYMYLSPSASASSNAGGIVAADSIATKAAAGCSGDRAFACRGIASGPALAALEIFVTAITRPPLFHRPHETVGGHRWQIRRRRQSQTRENGETPHYQAGS